MKEFNTWLQGQTLKGSELQQAATDEGFEASFASLALFPEVVSTLASNMDWTKEVGTAYLSDAEGVMASVQRLRDQAHDVGNLKTNDQQIGDGRRHGRDPDGCHSADKPAGGLRPVIRPTGRVHAGATAA